MPRRTSSGTLPSDRAPDRRDGHGYQGARDYGRDNTRPRHLTAEERALKDVERADARGNLAAMLCDLWGVDVRNPAADDIALAWAASEFRELCDELGLGGPW